MLASTHDSPYHTAEDIVMYSKLTPLYFPRSFEEEAKAVKALPEDIGMYYEITCTQRRRQTNADTISSIVGCHFIHINPLSNKAMMTANL